MPLPYYKRLSKRDRAIYRQSAALTDVPLSDPRACRPLARALAQALETEDRSEVERAAQRLVARMAYQLGTEPVAVRVLARRPRSATAELHGLYTREQGRRPVIQVWMRTAQHKRVASFRTFLRTLLHEFCHHLDYAYFELADSFHTEGFFKRESSLMRQLAPKVRPRPEVASAEAAEPAGAPRRRKGANKVGKAKKGTSGKKARPSEPPASAAPEPASRRSRQMDLPF